MEKIWSFFDKYTTLIIVLLSFSICIIYTTVCMILQYKGVNIDSTLTEWVFKFFGLELLALSGIKISKHIGSAFGRVEEKIDGLIESEDE